MIALVAFTVHLLILRLRLFRRRPFTSAGTAVICLIHKHIVVVSFQCAHAHPFHPVVVSRVLFLGVDECENKHLA